MHAQLARPASSRHKQRVASAKSSGWLELPIGSGAKGWADDPKLLLAETT
jgi:hypothetical protein